MTGPFAPRSHPVGAPDPGTAVLRKDGPVVPVPLPDGGTVWVVTDEELARRVLTDPLLTKDPALAPAGTPDLEPPAAERLSLTTADGPVHTRLRRAHAPLLGHRRVAEHAGRIEELARTLLDDLGGPGPVDLMAGFTTRYPLTVVAELVGMPPELLDDAAAACRAIWSPDPAESGVAFGRLQATCTAAVGRPGLATELRERLRADDGDPVTDDQVGYLVFGLVFAGQLTTDAALGSLLARALGTGLTGVSDDGIDELVDDVLRAVPPAPFTLWRFTTAATELAGHSLPAGSPVLVDVRDINAGDLAGPHLSFGYGPHFCVGAHLARLELRTVLRVLRDAFPHARLAAGGSEELVEVYPAGPGGSRLAELPVQLR
ncbi:cytochrome P450 [Pseudonocardia nematodicida]|uniref:Cytochrome P450 n=1 Tax=Pseudonocardia nematodicida TaxID=1206997 RepID=A0ABV1K6W1_9PSEU